MDHNNPAVKQSDQQYSHKQCAHGKCLNHDPKWENVGEKRLIPNPGSFGIETYWGKSCCGEAMARRTTVQDMQCRECGRKITVIANWEVALCLCCGYHFSRQHGGI